MLTASTLAMPAAAQSLPDRFDAGRGPQGELCQAERVWNDAASSNLFDVVYSVRCRGWTDTASVGRVGVFRSGKDALAQIRAAVAKRMICAAPAALTLAGFEAGEASRCRNGEGGYGAFAVTVPQRKDLLAIDGLERFAANLTGVARALVADDVQLAAEPGTAPDLSRLQAAATGSRLALAGTDAAGLMSQRSEVIEYSLSGQHGEARELATRYLAQLSATALPADRADFMLEQALSSSNLGYAEAAEVGLSQAAALIGALGGAPGQTLNRKLLVYRALDALNRRDYATALVQADAALQASREMGSSSNSPLADPVVLGQLNAGSTRSALARRDQSWVAPTILETQSQYVRAVSLRSQRRAADAMEALSAADRLLTRFDNSGLDTSRLQWLRSAVAGEQGRAARTGGDLAAARAAFARAVASLEQSSIYAGTPLLGQRHIELATAALAAGDPAAARTSFDNGFEILRTLGPSTAATVGGLDAWFDLLAADAAAGGQGAVSARAKFFEAAQLVSPPAVASQIAQLQKIFESGSSDGAVRAKTLQFLDREVRALSTRLTLLPADAAQRTDLEADLAAMNAQTAAVRAELEGDQQYQQANETVATLAELQRALRPGEAYLKLVTLDGRSYAMLVKSDDAVIYRTGIDTASLAELSQKVRRSIDGTLARDGRTIVLVFDVEGAHKLKEAIFGGAGPALDGVTTLITEPNGPMTQLPYAVLVEDEASVAAFDDSVKRNSRDYTKVRFLVRDRRIDSAVSPRSFLISRTLAASRASQPYLGLGNHAVPQQAALADLPQRGAFRGQCAARGDTLRAGFAALRPVGAAEIMAAREAMGVGAESVEKGAFTDVRLGDETTLGGTLKNFAVLHFATHGLKENELDCDSPPALVTSIAEDEASDGLLSFEEIAGLSLDANLVVLSACNTAASASSARARQSGFRSELGQAATLNGLARAFLVAGSRAVLTTHWAIPDSFRAQDGRTIEASTRLISQMFQAGRTGSMGGALRQAQMGMMSGIDTSHPYYWGAFMLVGDGARPMLGTTVEAGR
ncbi:hypothetical protein GCM10007973_01700 [Polymorphobacter multimanifer]|nr:hypothetical protein GCM10007973_01700 [Polymorphobacter multimanifer]